MFYLYIDEVLISSYHNFSEVRDFIFDFYYDIVKTIDCYDDDSAYYSMETFTLMIDSTMDFVIKGLICHQYEYFKFLDHEVQVYYGNS